MSLIDIVSGVLVNGVRVGGAAARCGLTPPTSLFGSSDPNVPLLIALAQEEGESLRDRHDWQALVVPNGTTTVATEVQTALPADFDRFLANTQLWNETQQLPYVGPVDVNTFEQLLFQSTAIPGAFLMVQNFLFIRPAPHAGDHLVFYYVSKNFVRSDTGVAKAAFTADSDTMLYPERLVGLGIIWRWKKSKGFAYAEDLATYERTLEVICSRDRGPAAPLILSKPRPSGGISSTWPGRIIV